MHPRVFQSVQLQGNQMFQQWNFGLYSKKFRIKARLKNRSESFFLNKHQIHRPCIFIRRIVLNKIAAVMKIGVSKFCQKLHPLYTLILADEKIQIARVRSEEHTSELQSLRHL